MAKKKKVLVAIVLIISVLAPIDFLWSIYQTELARFENKPGGPSPSDTLEESKARGTFLAELTVEPQSFEWDGKRISINEIWLERKAERTGTFAIIPLLFEWPTYTIYEGYDVCFIPAQGKDLPYSLDGFFVQEGKGASFAQRYNAQGGTLVWGAVPGPGFKEMSILVTNDWKSTKSVKLKILNPKAN